MSLPLLLLSLDKGIQAFNLNTNILQDLYGKVSCGHSNSNH